MNSETRSKIVEKARSKISCYGKACIIEKSAASTAPQGEIIYPPILESKEVCNG